MTEQGTILAQTIDGAWHLEDDPGDAVPTCDLCGGPEPWDDEMSDDWNPDTGNHSTCEAVERLTNPSDEEA